jgi:hypothetical protein
MNPADNPAIWLAILAVSTAVAAWNIARLRAVRPAMDRLVAILGGGAILALVVGASLVLTSVTECTLAPSGLACLDTNTLMVALVDLALAAALVTAFLRSDACRPALDLASRRSRLFIPATRLRLASR